MIQRLHPRTGISMTTGNLLSTFSQPVAWLAKQLASWIAGRSTPTKSPDSPGITALNNGGLVVIQVNIYGLPHLPVIPNADAPRQ
jgi:hypothetical protein